MSHVSFLEKYYTVGNAEVKVVWLSTCFYIDRIEMVNKIYRLFISHSWAYGDTYEKVVKMIREQGIVFYDHSVPQNNPIHTNGTNKQLKAAIEDKMIGTSCVLILAGVYSTYSKWINEEINIAKAYSKKIIAIEPWASERTSAVVKVNADRVVKWQGVSIANAIRELG